MYTEIGTCHVILKNIPSLAPEVPKYQLETITIGTGSVQMAPSCVTGDENFVIVSDSYPSKAMGKVKGQGHIVGQ